jgi:hypothetical protein
VFLQDHGGGTHEDLNRHLHHEGTGPCCPFGFSCRRYVSKDPLDVLRCSCLGLEDLPEVLGSN